MISKITSKTASTPKPENVSETKSGNVIKHTSELLYKTPSETSSQNGYENRSETLP